MDELEELNHSLRQRDKVKDDAVAPLSNCVFISKIMRLKEGKHKHLKSVDAFALIHAVCRDDSIHPVNRIKQMHIINTDR